MTNGIVKQEIFGNRKVFIKDFFKIQLQLHAFRISAISRHQQLDSFVDLQLQVNPSVFIVVQPPSWVD
jgi:hypothetical protein